MDEQLRRFLDANPGFYEAGTRFMTLYDASDILAELKPPQYALAVAYLREIADHVIREAGVPDELAKVMAASRPPLVEADRG